MNDLNRFIFYHLPFSFWGTIDNLIKKNNISTVLDLGCGDGNLMKVINKDNNLIVDGVDLFKKYVKKAKKTNCYRKLYNSDVLEFKPSQTYDMVFWSHNIEHLKKKDGVKLLKKILGWKIKLFVVMTPYGFFKQTEYDGNKYQEHKSAWVAEDFTKYGFEYKLKGFLSNFITEDGRVLRKTSLYKMLEHIVSPFFGKPEPYLICWKIK